MFCVRILLSQYLNLCSVVVDFLVFLFTNLWMYCLYWQFIFTVKTLK